MKKGFTYTAIGKYSNYLIQLVVQMVLSRLLTPKEFGVVAIMQVFIVFFALMVEAGMGPAIIQNKTLTYQDNNILFNFSAIFTVIVSIVFGFFGFFLSSFYNNSIFIQLTWLQSLSIMFDGLNIVPTALLYKNKKFKILNFNVVIANFISGALGVALAFYGFGVYSLIWYAICTSLLKFTLNMFFTNVSFVRELNLVAMKKIWSFSKNQFFFNFINYFSRNSDNILIGKFMGETAIANYSKSYQLLTMPSSLLLGIISPVLQPILSEYQDDVIYIRKISYKLVHFLVLISLPLSVFLSFTAQPIIFILFGNQWGNAVLPFRVLSLTIWSQIAVASFGGIIASRNKSEILVINGILNAIITVSSIIIGIIFGSINNVSICLTIAFIINFFISSYIIIKYVLDDHMKNYYKLFYSPILLSIIVSIFLWGVNIFNYSNVWLSFAINLIVFIVVFITYLAITKEINNVLKIFRKE
ncbi:lipopolysaccharide biosynthesis protein [Lactococcus lactis]|uniref:lipopolysaccharide biosynthesis protein n=1 Tax=Lactococcus lactis TaxID=1358 RepID=UPI00050D20E0|nr:lipopolysaccharide biosynthesis protein [Lactococcus lactis]AIS02727.1 Polysaccharide biosynthesis export protein [Lactococcus lactis]RHJ27129.1 lipopolysaccharide biosynthesis protein [Lactococcus lactis]